MYNRGLCTHRALAWYRLCGMIITDGLVCSRMRWQDGRELRIDNYLKGGCRDLFQYTEDKSRSPQPVIV
jgi:hypothetical protein